MEIKELARVGDVLRIPTNGEAEARGSFELRSLRLAGQHSETLSHKYIDM